MIKAFSLLELLIAIVVISIISTFAMSKLDYVFKDSNLVKLKSQYSLIQNGISNFKQKNILLNKNSEIFLLDESSVLKKNESLFSKVVDFDIVSTDEKDMLLGKWLKVSQTNYKYILSSNQNVVFILEDSFFKCKSPMDICKELQ